MTRFLAGMVFGGFLMALVPYVPRAVWWVELQILPYIQRRPE